MNVNKDRNKNNLGADESRTEISEINMIAPVQRINSRFKTQLGFRSFDWFLAEQIASKETDIKKLDGHHRIQLSLNIYPQQKTLLHMITAGFNKDDQSRSEALTKFILEAAGKFDIGVARTDTPIKFIVPMIADRDGKTPLQLMNNSNNKALLDIMANYYQYIYSSPF